MKIALRMSAMLTVVALCGAAYHLVYPGNPWTIVASCITGAYIGKVTAPWVFSK